MFFKFNELCNIKGVVSYKCLFGDLNDVQLKVVYVWGIVLLVLCEEVEEMDGKLVYIVDNDFYVVDLFIYFIFYLVLCVSVLFDMIGVNFLDLLIVKGFNLNKIIVIFVFWMENDVKCLCC